MTEKILDKKIIVVTGTSSGMGYAIANKLLTKGHTVIMISKNREKLEKSFNKLSGNKYMYVCDVRSSKDTKNLFKIIIKDFNKIDILVNSAGVSIHGDFEKLSARDFDEVIDTNLKGTFNMCLEAWKLMKNISEGHIINISSISGFKGYPSGSIYSASKFGVNGLMDALSYEGQECGIKVTNICPGQVDTDIWNPDDDDVNAARPLMLKPDAIADLVEYTISRDFNEHLSQIIIKPFAQQPYLRGRNKGPGGKFPKKKSKFDKNKKFII